MSHYAIFISRLHGFTYGWNPLLGAIAASDYQMYTYPLNAGYAILQSNALKLVPPNQRVTHYPTFDTLEVTQSLFDPLSLILNDIKINPAMQCVNWWCPYTNQYGVLDARSTIDPYYAIDKDITHFTHWLALRDSLLYPSHSSPP